MSLQIITVKVFLELSVEVPNDDVEHQHAQTGEQNKLVWEQSTEDKMEDLIKLDITSRIFRNFLESSFTDKKFQVQYLQQLIQ